MPKIVKTHPTTESLWKWLDSFQYAEKINRPKGYHFNENRERTFELLRGLLTNKKRYGYMACPCRLASGDKEPDRDIICPCEYRQPDVKEYGSCYCALYVAPEWNSGTLEKQEVPERRSLEKVRQTGKSRE